MRLSAGQQKRDLTIAKKCASVLHMRNVVGVTEAAVTAELLGWVGAALLDGLCFTTPVCLACIRGCCLDLRMTIDVDICTDSHHRDDKRKRSFTKDVLCSLSSLIC